MAHVSPMSDVLSDISPPIDDKSHLLVAFLGAPYSIRGNIDDIWDHLSGSIKTHLVKGEKHPTVLSTREGSLADIYHTCRKALKKGYTALIIVDGLAWRQHKGSTGFGELLELTVLSACLHFSSRVGVETSRPKQKACPVFLLRRGAFSDELVKGWRLEGGRDRLINYNPHEVPVARFQNSHNWHIFWSLHGHWIHSPWENLILNDPESLPFSHLTRRNKWIWTKPLATLFDKGILRRPRPRDITTQMMEGTSTASLTIEPTTEIQKRPSKLHLPPEITTMIIKDVPDRPISWLSDAVNVDVVILYMFLVLPIFSLVPMDMEEEARTKKALANVLRTYQSIQELDRLKPIRATRLVPWRLTRAADRREMYTILNWLKARITIDAHLVDNWGWEGSGVAVFLNKVPRDEGGNDLELCWVIFRSVAPDLIVNGVLEAAMSLTEARWLLTPSGTFQCDNPDFKALEYQYDPKQTFPVTPDRDESPAHICSFEWTPVIFTMRLSSEHVSKVLQELDMPHPGDAHLPCVIHCPKPVTPQT